MRLITRLVVSHTALAVLLGVVLSMMLVSLTQIHGLLGEVRERELGTLEEEERVHRAAWAVELAMRHGTTMCEASPDAVRASLESTLTKLREARRAAPLERRINVLAERYQKLGEEILGGDPCPRLRSLDRGARLQLDEEITDVWIARLFELHREIYATEEQARRATVRAIVFAVTLGLLSLVVAGLLARWMARGTTRPLAQLARAAQRIGRGDFSKIPPAYGPREVVELSIELEGMRARLEQLDSLKRGFVASVSHELRTPLTHLREALALLGDGTAGPLNEQQTEVVRIARSACEREIATVSTLLDLSRLRAEGGLKRERSRHLETAIQAAIQQERVEVERQRISIVVELGPPVPALDLDEALVERAVANLIRNAVSVSAAGQTVRVERRIVGAGPDGEVGRWVIIQVSDEGPGVRPEIRETLFDPFVTQTVPGRRIGIGLGLALAREVARAHHGDVRLVEREGPGASFALWLPLVEDDGPTAGDGRGEVVRVD